MFYLNIFDFQVVHYLSFLFHCISVYLFIQLFRRIFLQTSFLEEVKSVLRVFVLFIPLPVFWALFDQQVRSAGKIYLSKNLSSNFPNCTTVLVKWFIREHVVPDVLGLINFIFRSYNIYLAMWHLIYF